MRLKTNLFITVITITTLSLNASCSKDETTITHTTSGNAPATPSQQKLLDLINDVRTKGYTCGNTTYPAVAAVTWNMKLEAASQSHSNYMNNTNNFSHTGENGSNPGNRITAQGYIWRSYGENIADGYTSEEDVVQGWLESEGHCKNIMNADFTEMGIATSGSYWTQVFATHQ